MSKKIKIIKDKKLNKKNIELKGYDGGGDKSKADYQILNYMDKKNNIFISFKRGREQNYTYDFFNREARNNIVLELSILDARFNEKKPRAPKGLTREIMCELLDYITKIKFSNFTDKSKIYTLPEDFKHLGNLPKLKSMYEKMGFVKTPLNDEFYGTTIGTIKEWCHDTYKKK